MSSHNSLSKLKALSDRISALTPSGKLRSSLFPQQLAYVSDTTDIVAALCTRRAGKSVGGFASLYLTGMKHPGAVLPYITLTRRSAKNIIWPVIREENAKHNLGIEMKEAELSAVLPNGARIDLHGADTEAFISRLLGGKYPGVIIDEAQAFGTHLERLVFDVLQACTMDYRGYIKLQGTPGPIPHGLFYDLTKDGQACHRWSVRDNPYIPHAADWIVQLKEKRGWADNNPTFLREYCGQWVLDLDSLVYKCTKEKNSYSKLPDARWRHIISVDFGWADQTAFGVLAYSQSQPNAYIKRVYGRSHLTPSRIGEILHQLMSEFDADFIIADCGGLGRSLAEELKTRFGLPVIAAEKTEKATAIEMLNSDFIDGRIFVHESCTEYFEQAAGLSWEFLKGGRRIENPTLPNDLCDVVTYLHRMSRHYWHRPKAPAKTQAELVAEAERDMLAKVTTQYERDEYDSTGIGSNPIGIEEAWGDSGENW
jgi:hypothetical protein